MYEGYVVKYSDQTYYCETSENKKTASIQEATIFPKIDNRWMTHAGITNVDGWNVPILAIQEANELEAELIEVQYEVANIKVK